MDSTSLKIKSRTWGFAPWKSPNSLKRQIVWQNQRRKQPKYNASKPTFCSTNASPRPRLRWQTRLWPVVQWVHPLRFDTVIPPLRQYLGINGVCAMCKIMRTGGSRLSIESIGETHVAASNISSYVILCRCSSVIRHRRLDLTPPCGNRTPNTIALYSELKWQEKAYYILQLFIYIIIDHYSIQQIVGSCQEPHLSNSPSISLIHDVYTSERFELTSFLLFWKCSGNFYICVLALRYEGAFPCFPFPAKRGCEPVSTWWRIFKYRNHNPWLLSIPYFPKLKCGGSIVQYETSVHVWHFSIFVEQN